MGDGDQVSGGVTTLPAAANETAGDAADTALRRAMSSYQAGSLDAFEDIYAALAPRLLRYLRYLTRRSDLADDLLQETFLQMHRSRATYNAAYAVTPWAFGLARNTFLMQRRSAARFAAVHEVSSDPPDFPVPPDFERLAAGDDIRRAVASLNPDQAEPLMLHHVWGFSFDEIAGTLGISSAAARARSSRAVAALRERLGATKGSS
jgi:RNA polymerase sigma-70 factor, ECF subfamily